MQVFANEAGEYLTVMTNTEADVNHVGEPRQSTSSDKIGIMLANAIRIV